MELLVQLQVRARVRVIGVVGGQRGGGGRLGAGAAEGVHRGGALRTWTMKKGVLNRNLQNFGCECVQKLDWTSTGFSEMITSDGDGVAQAAGFRVQVKRRQTGHFVLLAGHAPSQTVLVQRAASTSSASPRPGRSTACFRAEGKV